MQKSLSVLIVEDLSSDAELAIREIKKYFKTFSKVVETESDFLNALHTFQPQIIVSDYRMPEFDGMRALELTLKHTPFTPFIMLTGSMNEDTAVECMKAGAADYVIKEHIKRLGPAVSSALDQKRSEKERTDAQLALRRSQERLQKAEEIAHLGSWEYDVQQDKLVWSREIYRILGIEAHEFDGTLENFLKFVHPQDRQRVESTYYESVKNNTDGYEIIHRVIRQNDGTVRTLHEKCEHYRESGKMIRSMGMAHDITELHHMRQELQESNRRLNLLIDNLDGFAYRCADDADWTMEYVSKGVRDLTGYPPEDFINNDKRAYASVILPEDRQRVEREVQRGLQRKASFIVEYRIQAADGQVKWVWERGKGVYKKNKLLALEGFISDISERKRAEQHLREDEEKLRNIFDSSPNSITITDLEGVVIDCNQQTLDLHAVEKKRDMLGRNVLDLISDADGERAWKNLQKALEGQPVQNVEYDILTPGGKTIPVSLSASVLKDSNGISKYFMAILTDMTERLKAEQAVREREQWFRRLADTTATAIFIFQGENFVYVNHSTELMTGYAQEELFNMRFWDVVHPDDQNLVHRRGMARQQGKSLPPRYEFKIVCKEHKVRWVDFTAGVIDWKGKTAVIGTCVDITERKMMEDALRESEEKFRNLIEQSNDAIYLLFNRRFEWINPKFQDMFHITLEQVKAPGFDFMQLVAPESRDDVEQRFKRVADDDLPEPSYQFTALTKEGRKLDVEVSISYINYRDGIATQGIIRDISERKRLQEKLNQSQKMESIGQLAAGVAHDFNNLLTVINGYSDFLLDDEKLSKPQKDMILEISQAGQRAADLTNQLLAFSRKQIAKPRIVDLNALVLDTQNMLQRLIEERIELKVTPAPAAVPIMIDPGQLNQILMNLTVNARDAMPNGGSLLIDVSVSDELITFDKQEAGSPKGRYALLSVSDTGAGIEKKIQKRIFDPFFTTKQLGEGTGLGLSTIYGIVKQNDGHVSVYSEVGLGTTFNIYFPLAVDDHLKKEANDKDMNLPHGSETLLLVEDEYAVRTFITDVLTRYGYTVISAESPEVGIRMYKENCDSINLLLTDVVMPGMNGQELYKVIHQLNPHLPVVYISGYPIGVISRQGIVEHDVVLIQKPLRIDKLLSTLREALDGG
ncbi:MAG: PAS domain S-box protein [candidate division KSB1 bacterium]|nr:PAS domain S-box protein [candidate division KSB1 bacterium]